MWHVGSWFPDQGLNSCPLQGRVNCWHAREVLCVSYLLFNSFTEVKVAQLCPTLCDPMDYTVHGILQARRLEWVAFPRTKEPGGYSPWGHKELDTTERRILFFLSLFLLGISWWSLEDTALLTIWHLLFYFLKQQCSFLIAQGFLSKKSHCPLASLRESDPLKVPLNLINITGQVPLETVLTSRVTQFHQLRQD